MSTHPSMDIVPRIIAVGHPGSSYELLVQAVMLGFGTARVTVSMPNGQTHKLIVNHEGGNNNADQAPWSTM